MSHNRNIVWTHSFRDDFKGSGVFMFVQLKYMSDLGVSINQICFKKIFNPLYFILQLVKFYILYSEILHSQYGSGNAFFS